MSPSPPPRRPDRGSPDRGAESRPDARPPAPGERSGPRGERLAAQWLRQCGFRIEAHNLRTVHGEIDLLARRFRTWVAVEVKARADHPAPERLVDDERLQRLARALRALAPTLRPRPWRLRIDVIAVRWIEPPEVRHFPNVRTVALPRD